MGDIIGQESDRVLMLGQMLLYFKQRASNELRIEIFCVAGRKSVGVGGDKLRCKFTTFSDVDVFPDVQDVFYDFFLDILGGSRFEAFFLRFRDCVSDANLFAFCDES